MKLAYYPVMYIMKNSLLIGTQSGKKLFLPMSHVLRSSFKPNILQNNFYDPIPAVQSYYDYDYVIILFM